MVSICCKFCTNFSDKHCQAKTSGGKPARVSPNKSRKCDKFKPDPIALAKEVDREYKKSKIPVYSPTWRYYADKKELEELNANEGLKFVRINPDV